MVRNVHTHTGPAVTPLSAGWDYVSGVPLARCFCSFSVGDFVAETKRKEHFKKNNL
jgi:hypothetical protein